MRLFKTDWLNSFANSGLSNKSQNCAPIWFDIIVCWRFFASEKSRCEISCPFTFTAEVFAPTIPPPIPASTNESDTNEKIILKPTLLVRSCHFSIMDYSLIY